MAAGDFFTKTILLSAESDGNDAAAIAKVDAAAAAAVAELSTWTGDFGSATLHEGRQQPGGEGLSTAGFIGPAPRP